MANHSRGVSLRNRTSGLHRWRDEVTADGGKPYLRRKIRRSGKQQFRRELAKADY